MEIRFKDDKLRTLCENERATCRKLGDVCARKLRSRLADLGAAHVVTDLVAGRPHPLKVDRAGQFAVDLTGGVRLVFVPAHDPVPRMQDGSIDWSGVSIIQIEFIGDYHD